MAKIPEFETLDQAVEFWESHDSADYWEEMGEATFEVDLRRNLLHPRLTVLTHRPRRCPRCQDELEDSVIEYVTWSDGHLIVIRDVPVLRCRTHGHEYILEKTLDRIEELLRREKTQSIRPTGILQVPVFDLGSIGG